MGYHHITDLNLSHHSFNNNAKPNSSSPLIIMPKPNNNTTTASSSAPSPYHGCPNPTTNLLALSDDADLVAANDVANVGSKGELSNEQQPLGSSRWNPTPEQLLALEELYRRGTRTPSAAQIQQIAIRLRRFGKIEGKNVFYWFQNHKARERQKRRREVLETEHEQPKHQQCDTKSSEKKEPAGSSGYEIEETKDKVPPPNLSKLSEEFISTHGVAAESGPNEWIQIQDKELQQRNSTGRRSVSTWQACSPIYLINSLNSATSLAAKTALNAQTLRLGNITTLEDENREEQTLELFPLGSNYDRYKNGINISRKDTTQVPIRAINTSFTPNQYFEFLPLKN